MQALELKVPPVAVVLCIAALMWLASWAMPSFGFTIPAREIISLSVAVAGVVISGSGVVSFRRARTTVNPLKPESASSLVKSGIYLLSRNPMYLGLLVILLGWAVFLANALAFVLLPAFIVVHESVSNRTGGKGARFVVWKGIRVLQILRASMALSRG